MLAGIALTIMVWYPALGAPDGPAPGGADYRSEDYTRLLRDLHENFWNSATARIMPTNPAPSDIGGHPLTEGVRNDSLKRPSFWQAAQYVNVLYWAYKALGSQSAREQIASEWRYIQTIYPPATLASANSADGIVNAEDDGSCEAEFLAQINDSLNDPQALRMLGTLIANLRLRFADPARSGAGLIYKNDNDDLFSTGYETGLAIASLYTYERTHYPAFLNYAESVWSWEHKFLKHPAGVYFNVLDLNPTPRGGSPPATYLKPGGYKKPADIRRGGSVANIGNTIAMAVLSTRLYAVTRQGTYLQEARDIVASITSPDTFLRQGRVFLNDQDAWTDGYWFPALASDVLTRPDIGAAAFSARVLQNTAAAVAAQRTASGFYPADWSGPEDNGSGIATWLAQGKAREHAMRNPAPGMALPEQIMTSASSGAVIVAAEIIARSAH